MSIEAIGAAFADLPATGAITPEGSGTDFLSMIGNGIARVDESLKTADSQLRALAAGEDIPVHELMISMERARTDLMLMAEVRNRVIEGYQELTRMQL